MFTLLRFLRDIERDINNVTRFVVQRVESSFGLTSLEFIKMCLDVVV